MYCRSGFFIGTVEAENREAFKTQIEGAVVEAMMKFPGLKHLAVKWAREHEDGAPAIYLALEHSYASPADLETALASEARAGVREAVEVVLPYFQGTIVHVNSEVREFAA